MNIITRLSKSILSRKMGFRCSFSEKPISTRALPDLLELAYWKAQENITAAAQKIHAISIYGERKTRTKVHKEVPPTNHLIIQTGVFTNWRQKKIVFVTQIRCAVTGTPILTHREEMG